MNKIAKVASRLQKAIPLASQILSGYEVWLIKRFGKIGNYLTNAKTFLKTSRDGSEIVFQLNNYMSDSSFTMQSILRRFRIFLEEKDIQFVTNDLIGNKVPIGNIYVKLFLANRKDRLRGEYSLSTYATILNQFFNLIDNDLRFFNKRWAEKFIHSPALSDFTKRLYKSVLKTFCDWALLYQLTDSKQLSKEQIQVQKGLCLISAQSLREIAAIKVQSSRGQIKRYHKESLTIKQRDKLLKLASTQRERAIISIMAWNGLRTIEMLRLTVSDFQFKELKVAVWGKGKSAKSKELIRLFDVPKLELKKHFKENGIASGKAFPNITKKEIADLIGEKFIKLGVNKLPGKFSPHSLRHTAGQIMYDKGIPLEFIQKTLRHSSLETTMVYAQKAIDRKYFQTMPRKI